MAEFTAEALEVLRIAAPILERDHGIPESHFQHQCELIVDVLKSSPGLVVDVFALIALAEHGAAQQRVRSAMATLKEIDPCAFFSAPSPRLLALLTVGGKCDAGQWASAVSSADYATTDERRRRALKIRREMYEAGEVIPTEDDVEPRMLGRDAALADQALTGGGLRASRIS
jgi:hypothetical protein